MTLQYAAPLLPQSRGQQTAPGPFKTTDISVVVPVKNNRDGVHRLLSAWLTTHSPEHFPREILIVDNASCPPLSIAPHYAERGLHVTLLSCSRPGPARARNVGWRAAQANWIFFLDSDCIPTEATLTGYLQDANGAIGYAGSIYAATSDCIPFYYEQQGILTPPFLLEEGVAHPTSLITANALVWKPALIQIGGFDEQFSQAAGEDLDLGLRLWQVGPLSYAPDAQVAHAFEPGLRCFIKRFVRYGRGNRLLSQCYNVDLSPRPFLSTRSLWSHRCLAILQYLCLWWGYQTGRKEPVFKPVEGQCSASKKPDALLKNASSRISIALFIDGDNISAKCLSTIRAQEQLVEGDFVIRRVYRRALPAKKRDPWDQARIPYSLEIVTVEQTHPNATDEVLIREVKVALHERNIQQIWLVSGDGGYAPLVRILLDQGYDVLILGPRATSQALRKTGASFRLL